MKHDVAIPVAKALYQTLSGFHPFNQEPLRAVRYAYNEKSLERVTLAFDRGSLVVTANPEDDSVEFTVAAITEDDSHSATDASHLDHWRSFIGEPFGWGWIT